jgi:hypothetical protein
MMLTCYGLELDGLPLAGVEAGASARGRLRWRVEAGRATRTSAEGPPEWLHEEPDAVVIGWAGYAEYRVARAPSPEARVLLTGADPEQAALGLLLSVLPLSLPLFGLEPLHGSAVAADGRALLLLGASGTGKSTLASRLSGLGWRFLADDACGIDGVGRLWPGPPFLARRSAGQAWPVVGSYDAKTVVQPPGHRPDPVTPAALAVLAPSRGASLGVRPLDRPTALRALLANVRAPRALPRRRRALQLHVISRLGGLPVAEVSYELGHHSGSDVASSVAAWAAGQQLRPSPAAIGEGAV